MKEFVITVLEATTYTANVRAKDLEDAKKLIEETVKTEGTKGTLKLVNKTIKYIGRPITMDTFTVPPERRDITDDDWIDFMDNQLGIKHSWKS